MLNKEDAKKKYGENDPNKKNVFINWDAIDALPDELEVVFSELIFDPQKLDEYFTNVGSEKKPSWYPQTDTMYKIAEMCNIVGEKTSIVEWIYEEVDINPLLMKPLEAEPTMRKIKTGARVTKRSMVLCEDNTWRPCAPETNEFNYWNRACLDFANDEDYTNGYTKKDKYGNTGKYSTPIKRKKRYLELEKFAIQQAETKAFCKTVRVLAGLPTGFDTEDLKDGKLVFHKFVKSKRIQKLETAARIEAIRQGKTGDISQITDDLYNEKQIEAPEQEAEVIEASQEVEPETKPEPEPETKTEDLKTIFGESKEKNEKENKCVILQEYIKEGSKNRKILERKKGAIETIEKAIVNYEKENLDDIIARIERVPGIEKISLDEPGEDSLF